MTFIERIIKSLTPYLCIICGTEGNILCDPCCNSELILSPSACFMCNKVSADFTVCKQCAQRSKLRHVWFVSEYDGVVKDVILAYKYTPLRGVSEQLSGIIADRIDEAKFDYVTYIPTVTSRVRQRGFDHAQLLAFGLARRKHMKYKPILLRTSSVRQVGATRSQRYAQMELAYRLRVHPSMIKNKRILIVDDVVSTGATLASAAKLLRESGAKEVSAVVIARNLG